MLPLSLLSENSSPSFPVISEAASIQEPTFSKTTKFDDAIPHPPRPELKLFEDPLISTSYSRHLNLRTRYRSPVTYWPGTNIPIYQIVRGL
ncbi:hypothetical protein DSO57_1021051 [Entomophthora muscae]|uniref:Uncharacterized protein n=1 Tax=Entomophthora muscae TaxID=34485 RepID=A0ACC2SGJ2_9FUNG|nr:hypothetical protein DSO57_1021051 [Entomophthora muscae]